MEGGFRGLGFINRAFGPKVKDHLFGYVGSELSFGFRGLGGLGYRV